MDETEKNELLSISKDFGELGLDTLLEDGLFKDIPFIGTGISVVKLINSFSDRILLTKILHFINELGLKNQKEVSDFKDKYLKDKDYSKIGSKILLVLERADSLTKIQWLAKSLRLFVDQEISKNEFLRICSIINSAYVEDVHQITVFDRREKITSHNDLIDAYVLDHLFSIGLLANHGFDGGNAAGTNAGTIYALNKFGKILKEKII
ncbi:hypothetical protein [Rufibacter psychrotolerans]|uniref:hypothetical protein n=1 Tax=Rufibacter psychrotolerans TaxID=2812556 RepID=UPI0019672B98|nr:hypothetical protein [Rufibacter sp. SYSU D00308]